MDTHRHAPFECVPAWVHNRQGPSCWNTNMLCIYDTFILFEYTSSRPF